MGPRVRGRVKTFFGHGHGFEIANEGRTVEVNVPGQSPGGDETEGDGGGPRGEQGLTKGGSVPEVTTAAKSRSLGSKAGLTSVVPAELEANRRGMG